jgi:uncharacterized membrane protein YoaT (DUF817 family)
MTLWGWRWETSYSWAFTYPLRWNQTEWMCGLFLQHAPSEGNSSQNSVTSHDLCHPVYGQFHLYAHAADVLHILLNMHTNLWCAYWANSVVADETNPMPLSTSFSLTCVFFTSLAVYSDTCRLKPFHVTVNCYHVWKRHITKLLSEFTSLLIVTVCIVDKFTMWQQVTQKS